MTAPVEHDPVLHEGCWFCSTPMCEHCPDVPTPVWEDLRDAAVLVCPTCAGVAPAPTGAGACRDCGAPAGAACFDHCPSGMAEDLEHAAAVDVENAYEAQGARLSRRGAA